MFFEDMVNNDIIPAMDKTLAQTYEFKFFGYSDETNQTEVSLRQAQMTTFASMNDLLKWEEKKTLDEPAANLPLNQAFWNLCQQNMTRGEIRERFFGDKGASQRKELQYIPGDQAFLAWQQLLMTKEQMSKQEELQKQQMEAQQQEQSKQAEAEATKDKREQQKHDQKTSATRSEQARQAVATGNNPLQQLQEAAQATGASKSSNIGGTVTANPINVANK
jgi:hypothetical protein